MELKLSPQEKEFRENIRKFMENSLPEEIRYKVEMGLKLEKDDYVTWQKIVGERGWLAPGWPKEYGGTGWSPIERHIFNEEMALASAPRIQPFGVNMVGPVIIAFGNETQKQYYLPRILSSEDWWCQGYSEPGSGSDLAALNTRAIRDGDYYIVNGAKTWTSFAQHADMMFCLVRTSTEGKKQAGISFLLIDMKSPGIEVRPIITMDGGDEINDVLFEDVRVPITNLVGEENHGWEYAKFLLGHERTWTADIGASRKQIKKVREIASKELVDGKPLIEDPTFQIKISEVEIELLALESVLMQVLEGESAGKSPGPEASLLKLRGTEIQQEITELLFEAIGNYAHPFVKEALDAGWNEESIGPDYAASIAPRYFNYRKTTIYGGSSEIQKNIIAKAVLGL
ncbi:MAG: pimeloyl-CoA dehydrogenase large subunit [Alphaproteobacteria bacterium]|jgi:alkylation response protein AidB-like acyl-CoA dehydrogenase|nr:pimeloyl-CoA dehydrogenase large subunit [Alphaproteobacteria bacterium]PPR14636.1 MAG: Acryloyl-CoA reductase (NADH) [Alphaproteobacteria bacterium MarineAlpha12_Bin1]|tara:strand:+ start:11709 stop:12905 length:1197 start_codon:yes stop_codon:yes gene_type:complete